MNEDSYIGLRNLIRNPDSYIQQNTWSVGYLYDLSVAIDAFVLEIDANKYRFANKQERQEYVDSRVGVVLQLMERFLAAHFKEIDRWQKENIPQIEKLTKATSRLEQFVKRIKNLQSYIMNDNVSVLQDLEKLRWMGTPEQFGYIFGQLLAKGYIELPSKSGEGSFSEMAEMCLRYFNIEVSKGKNRGKPTTKENLERALNPNSNQLSAKGKASLDLPSIKDLI